MTNDGAGTLDPSNPRDLRHLAADVDVAEELAIRYADAALRARRVLLDDSYVQARNECLASLVAAIAAEHDVPTETIRPQIGRRPRTFDAMVFVLFGGLFAVVSGYFVGSLLRRVGDHQSVAIIATLVASVVFSAAGVLIGEVWAGAAEGWRLHTAHMSYRALRVPWGQHRLQLFLAGVVLFWVVALFRWRVLLFQLTQIQTAATGCDASAPRR